MLATTLYGTGDIRFEEVPDPTVVEPTDAVVRVVSSCVCGSDLWWYRGQNDLTDPGRTIGHECLGIVVATGAAVRDFREGDFVIVPFCHSDNTCPVCRAGVQSACPHGGMTVSGQAEFARVTQADGSLHRVDADPASLDDELLSSLLSLSDVFPTGWHAAVSAGVQPGSSVVVVGDGAVGLCGVLAASQLGAETIVAMSRHADRQAIARAFGATHVVAERGEEGDAAVRETIGAYGADAVLECVGTGDAMTTAFAVARPGATVGFVGVPHGVELPLRRMFSQNVGLRGGVASVRRYLPELTALVLERKINPGLVFDSVLPLAEVAEGYRRMSDREATKVRLTL